MRYSYEFKRKAIELFNQGEWTETPTGVLTHTFHDQIRRWAKQEMFNGPEIISIVQIINVGLQRRNMS